MGGGARVEVPFTGARNMLLNRHVVEGGDEACLVPGGLRRLRHRRAEHAGAGEGRRLLGKTRTRSKDTRTWHVGAPRHGPSVNHAGPWVLCRGAVTTDRVG